MKTLHLCHWSGRKHFQERLFMLGEQDSLTVYGKINSNDKKWLHDNLVDLEQPWFLVVPNMKPDSGQIEIDTDQWLALIIKHKNTLTWK